MITILNRKEICVTYDSKRQAEVRDILAGNGIDYQIKTINRNSPSILSSHRVAVWGVDSSMDYLYKIYVHKEDYERAYALINK